MKTSELTGCAMFCALFGVLAVINLQSAGVIADWVPFLFALPSFCALALYPLKASLAAAASMNILSFLIGGLQGLLIISPYIVSGGLIGLGSRAGWKRGWLLFGSTAVLSLSVLGQYTIFAALFGCLPGELMEEVPFMKEILQPFTILLVMSVFMGGLQGLCLIMLAFLLERRLPRYFGSPAPFGFWRPKSYAAWLFLVNGVLLASFWNSSGVVLWIRDALLVSLVLLFGILVYTGWLFWLPKTFESTSIVRLLLNAGMWIFPVNLAYFIMGWWTLWKQSLSHLSAGHWRRI